MSDYIIGLKIGNEIDAKKKKTLLIISVVINLGILGFFKYYNFFVDSFVELFDLFGLKKNVYIC